MSAKRARLDNVELAFEDVGTGPALLLIHAGICDRRMWRPQFEAWASRYRMIAPDLRGCGDSSLPPGPFRHDVDLARLLDHLGIDKVAAIGVSMGGEVALGLALAAPERVAALVLSTTRAGTTGVAPEIAAIWREVDVLLTRGEIDAANELELKAWMDGPRRTPGMVDPAMRALVAEMNGRLLRRSLDPAAELAVELDMGPPPVERLGDVAMPTLVISTSDDQPEVLASCERLAREIPGARQVTIDGAAHLPNLERPGVFNDAVEQFLISTGW